MNRIDEILTELQRISESKSEKTITLWVQPIDEGWSCEFDFSDEELGLTHDLTDELDSLMNFRVTFPLFPYRPKFFSTFKDAAAWAQENPGRVITTSPDGKGFISK